MGRKVKLQDTGEFGTSDHAYQAPNKKYYSTESAYKKIALNGEYRVKCVSAIYDLLGYKDFMKLPTYFYKRLKDCEGYGYDVVFRCIQKKSKDIQWAIEHKDFSSEVGKMMYLWAILDNSMNDALKEVIQEKRESEKIEKSKLVEGMVGIDLNINSRKQKTVDISRFLED